MAQQPTLRERIGMALDVATGRAFKPAASNDRARDLDNKKFSFAWPAWREGKPDWQIVNFQGYITEGFNLNALIYNPIMYKARSVARSPLRAYQGDFKNPEILPETHPLSKLAVRPNPWQSHIEFQQQSQVYLNLAGENFTLLDRPKRGALPTAMFSVRPDRVRIVPGDGGIKGYIYVPEGRSERDGVPILPDDMIHIKLPNPGDPLEGLGHGLSPISSVAHSADVDNMVTEFLKMFFERSAQVAGVLKFKVPIEEEMMFRIKDRWQEQYGSFRNWAEIGVLDGDAEYQRVGLTFEEMGFTSLDDRNESRVLGPFGVPPILVGARIGLEHGTYSNYKEARLACWEDTLIPELLLFEVEYTHYLRDVTEQAFVLYDFSDVPALQRDMPALIAAAKQLFDMGVPRDLALSTVGLDVEGTDFGDVSFLPAGYTTAERIIEPPAPPPPPVRVLPAGAIDEDADDDEENTPPLLPDGKGGHYVYLPPFPVVKANGTHSYRFTAEHKVFLWWKKDQLAKSWEGQFGDRAETQFGEDQRALLSILKEHKSRSMSHKVSVDWSSVEQDWRTYVTGEGWDAWRATFQPVLRGVMTDNGQEWASTLGVQFDTRLLDANSWFDQYVLQFAQPINDTTLETLHEMTSQATFEGWSIPKMQSHLGTLFEQWMHGDLSADEFEWFDSRTPPHRRELIARTESMKALNAGSNQLFDQWGVQFKEWLHTQDGRVRATHRTAGQMYQEGGSVGPIPIHETFTVGNSRLMFPGDPNGDIGEIANCRCTELPFIPDGTTLAP